MTEMTLKYLSQNILVFLLDNVSDHLERYIGGNFNDLSSANGWAVETSSLKCDVDQLATLEHGSTSPEIEIKNSQIVFSSLTGITPSVARDERIWTRLTHVECLEFSRSRWLLGKPVTSAEKLVRDHFFASSLAGVRDDNAVGRLWWNGYIASQVMPDSPERALKQILKTADIRQAVVERSLTFSRPALAKAIILIMEAEPWISATEANFRAVMKRLNRNGSGLLFEILPEKEVLDFVISCAGQSMKEDAQIAAQ